MCQGMHGYMLWRATWGIGSLLPLCGPQELNSRCQGMAERTRMPIIKIRQIYLTWYWGIKICPLFFIFVFVDMCVCVWYVCARRFTCTATHLMFWDTSSHCTWHSLIGFDQLISKFSEHTCLCFWSTGWSSRYTTSNLTFRWETGIRTEFLRLTLVSLSVNTLNNIYEKSPRPFHFLVLNFIYIFRH